MSRLVNFDDTGSVLFGACFTDVVGVISVTGGH